MGNAAAFNSRPPGTESLETQSGTPVTTSGRPVFVKPNPMLRSTVVTSNGNPVRADIVELKVHPLHHRSPRRGDSGSAYDRDAVRFCRMSKEDEPRFAALE